jgi:hypothetical protein
MPRNLKRKNRKKGGKKRKERPSMHIDTQAALKQSKKNKKIAVVTVVIAAECGSQYYPHSLARRIAHYTLKL